MKISAPNFDFAANPMTPDAFALFAREVFQKKATTGTSVFPRSTRKFVHPSLGLAFYCLFRDMAYDPSSRERYTRYGTYLVPVYGNRLTVRSNQIDCSDFIISCTVQEVVTLAKNQEFT